MRFLARGVTWVAVGWSVGGIIAAAMHGHIGKTGVFTALTCAAVVNLWLLAGDGR